MTVGNREKLHSRLVRAESNHKSAKQSPVMHCLSLSVCLCTRHVDVCLDQYAVRGGMRGGKGEKRLVQLIQLMKDLCSESSCLPLSSLQISSAPHLASQCVSSKKAREGRTRGEKQTKMRWREKGLRKRKSSSTALIAQS